MTGTNGSTQDVGTRRRRSRRGEGERLRRELLDAAAALIAEAGDASRLSLRAVAARAGVAPPSVYLHFADIDEVKGAVAQEGFSAYAAARDAAVAGVTDPVQVLMLRCHAYVRFALAHPGLYRLMFGRDRPLLGPGDSVDVPSRHAFAALAETIGRCQRAGACPADADPAGLAVLVWTALHGQASLRLDRPDFPWPPLDETVTEAVRRLVGLAAPS